MIDDFSTPEALQAPPTPAGPTAEQLKIAAKNAMAAGDRDAARQLMQAAYEIEGSGDPSEGGGSLQVGNFDTGIPTSQGVDRVLSGIGRGQSNVARHAGNLVGQTSDQELLDARELDQPLLDTTGGAAGNFIGETTATALPAMGTTAAVARMGAPGMAIARNMISRGALEGASQSALMADPDQSKLFEAVKGAGFGAAIPATLRGGQKAIQGATRTDAAQRLLDQGISLTPGQMNPGGAISALEELAPMSMLAKGPREGAKGDWNRVIAETAAAPGTKIQPGPMKSMLDAAYQSFAPLYDQAKGFLVGAQIVNQNGPNVLLSQAFLSAGRTAGTTTNVQKAATGWLRSELQATMAKGRKRGNLMSDDLIDLRSKLRGEIRSFNKKTDAESSHYVRIYEKAEKKLTEAIDSQLPPDALNAMRTADMHYGEYKNLEDAVFRSTSRDGGPTPHELLSALKAASGTKGSFARGASPNQRLRQLAEDASVSFAENPRAKTGASMLLASPFIAASLAKPMIGVPLTLGAAALSLTNTGRRAAAGQFPMQQSMQGQLNKLLNRVSPEALNLSNEYAQRALLTSQNEE